MKKITLNGLIYGMAVAAMLWLGAGTAFAQKEKAQKQPKAYKTIPSSSFFTVNAEYLGGYRPDQFFSAQVPAFGFKAGTMRNVGWYVGAMTNFNFKGAFVSCEEADIVAESTSTTYFDALAGITLRYWKPFSFHLGLGYSYRSFNNQTVYGQWAHIPSHTAQGPAMAAGFMLHLGGFVVSAEVLGSYNLQGLNDFNYHVDKTRLTFGLKAGLGVCIPYNYRSEYRDRTPLVIQVPAIPTSEQPVETASERVEPTDQDLSQPKSQEIRLVEQDVLPNVITLPVSQLSQGWVTVSGEVVNEGAEAVTERGVCWGTDPYPTVTGTHTSDGEGPGYFTTVVSGLQSGKTYYIRAYAGTRSGVRYGNAVSVTLPDVPQTQPTMPQQPAPPAFQQPMMPPQSAAPASQQPPMPQPPVAPSEPANNGEQNPERDQNVDN